MTLLPADAANRFFDAYRRADDATMTRARGQAVLRALGLIETAGMRSPGPVTTGGSPLRAGQVRLRPGFCKPLFGTDRPLPTGAFQTTHGLVADTVSNEAAQVRGPAKISGSR
ncbi:hypothetical protein [Streptosporangium roseum]|uniref:hypothetical protein n=1 Tax=Streptosporangium roseum TaxID=2001 RepID=UPI003328235A